MTTEVAVLNRLAVALAADSASTIDTVRGRKIYHTANKIFDLSDHQPLGLMIYGNADFMGLPFELLIKEFRRTHSLPLFDTVAACVDTFIKYLETGVKFGPQDEDGAAISVLRTPLTRISAEINGVVLQRWFDELSKHDPRSATPRPDIIVFINQFIRTKLTEVQSQPPSPCFGAVTATAIATKYAQAFDVAVSAFMQLANKNAETTALLHEYAAEIIYRDNLSTGRAGIVVAGFGAKELCPALRSIELDGVFLGKLKWRSGDTVEVSQASVGAKIFAFAQDDIAEMFLTGISPEVEAFVTGYVDRALGNLVSAAKQAVTATGAQTLQVSALDAEIPKLVSDFRSAVQQQKEGSRRRVLNMVRFMPVQELVVLAESLIEITSLKRRVTDDLETVGGAVDVAAITRSEGLVWIKRKHYFEPELNTRFFMRQGKKVEQRSGDDDDKRGKINRSRKPPKA